MTSWDGKLLNIICDWRDMFIMLHPVVSVDTKWGLIWVGNILHDEWWHGLLVGRFLYNDNNQALCCSLQNMLSYGVCMIDVHVFPRDYVSSALVWPSKSVLSSSIVFQYCFLILDDTSRSQNTVIMVKFLLLACIIRMPVVSVDYTKLLCYVLE